MFPVQSLIPSTPLEALVRALLPDTAGLQLDLGGFCISPQNGALHEFGKFFWLSGADSLQIATCSLKPQTLLLPKSLRISRQRWPVALETDDSLIFASKVLGGSRRLPRDGELLAQHPVDDL